MSSDESNQSESEFYYLDEMANDDNEKENIAVITSEENQENVFRLENVQNYILAQRGENTIKKTWVLASARLKAVLWFHSTLVCLLLNIFIQSEPPPFSGHVLCY